MFGHMAKLGRNATDLDVGASDIVFASVALDEFALAVAEILHGPMVNGSDKQGCAD